jgi:hypothetical protein
MDRDAHRHRSEPQEDRRDRNLDSHVAGVLDLGRREQSVITVHDVCRQPKVAAQSGRAIGIRVLPSGGCYVRYSGLWVVLAEDFDLLIG